MPGSVAEPESLPPHAVKEDVESISAPMSNAVLVNPNKKGGLRPLHFCCKYTSFDCPCAIRFYHDHKGPSAPKTLLKQNRPLSEAVFISPTGSNSPSLLAIYSSITEWCAWNYISNLISVFAVTRSCRIPNDGSITGSGNHKPYIEQQSVDCDRSKIKPSRTELASCAAGIGWVSIQVRKQTAIA